MRPTATTWIRAPVLSARATAFMAASSACGEPSVASRIREGKVLTRAPFVIVRALA